MIKAKKQDIQSNIFVNHKTKFKKISIETAIELFDVILPKKGIKKIVRTTVSRPITDFIKGDYIGVISMNSSFRRESHKDNIDTYVFREEWLTEDAKDFLKDKKVKFTDNHSKVLIFISNKKKYVIHGSGVAGFCSQKEVYSISQDDLLYDKIKAYVEKI